MGVVVELRRANTADAESVAEITVEGWRAAYAGLVPDAYLADLSLDAHVGRARERLSAVGEGEVWVAEDGSRVLGYASFGPSRDPGAPPDSYELYALYVRPEAWRRGIGRSLLARAIERTKARGAARFTLWVFEGNRAGRAFYEAHGWRQAAECKDVTLGGRVLPVVGYVRRLSRPA